MNDAIKKLIQLVKENPDLEIKYIYKNEVGSSRYMIDIETEDIKIAYYYEDEDGEMVIDDEKNALAKKAIIIIME